MTRVYRQIIEIYHRYDTRMHSVWLAAKCTSYRFNDNEMSKTNVF